MANEPELALRRMKAFLRAAELPFEEGDNFLGPTISLRFDRIDSKHDIGLRFEFTDGCLADVVTYEVANV